jgi:hypothetical protein
MAHTAPPMVHAASAAGAGYRDAAARTGYFPMQKREKRGRAF